MSLELSNSPGKPVIKAWFDNVIHLQGEDCEIQICMKDFMAAAYYALVNNPLEENDSRLVFLRVVSRLSQHGKQFFYKDKEAFSLFYPGDYKSEQ